MKQKKEVIVKDERTLLLDGKVASEIVLGMLFFIAVSVLVKVYVLDLELMAYLPEGLLLMAIGVYAFIRRWSLGIDIRDMFEMHGWFSRIGSGLLFALFMTGLDIFGRRESTSFMLSPKYLIKILLEILIFVLLTYLMEKCLSFINQKKQEKIEAGLED
ncbi:DUF6773 family protein [Streptococcus sp. DD13]|uniref:DUF6773 family protein n=1 Tax=Streptococcus sp. DD13 TaxID=1777881 RepID=UPI000798B956|nr:DUF6773 family protein [Streptococcus sp. DD13]KXT78739.1 hypothetical protein STRDD13_00471 [Streptococcus sp. DD13]